MLSAELKDTSRVYGQMECSNKVRGKSVKPSLA